MPGPTLQQRLDHLLQNLAEAEREYAAGVSYPDHTGQGSWLERIARIKQHIAELQSPTNNRLQRQLILPKVGTISRNIHFAK